MIYLGNLPVCPAAQLLGDGYRFKWAVLEENMTESEALKDFIIANTGGNADAVGINASAFGKSGLTNQTVLGFWVQVRNGDFMTNSSAYIRENTGQFPQFRTNWGSTYGAIASQGDRFLIVYKEVTA